MVVLRRGPSRQQLDNELQHGMIIVGRITSLKWLTVADTHTSDQFCDGLLIQDVPDHAIGFALEEPALGSTGYDATCILSSVL
jgi:hypothetical protein